MTRTVISTPNAPAAVGPYSQAIKANGFVFTAGQLGLVPASGKMVAGDAADQARQALENLKAILEEAGASLVHVVKVTIFLKDMADFKRVNEVYASYFPEQQPARSTFQVAALPVDGLVEIEAVAIVP